MKRVNLSVLLFLLFALTTKAQEVRVPKKENVNINKNKTVTIDNILFDYRVLKHYSEEMLMQLTATKRKQVNYIYTKSYELIDNSLCTSLSVIDIDVAKLEIYRKQDTEAFIDNYDGCTVRIKLESRSSMVSNLDKISIE